MKVTCKMNGTKTVVCKVQQSNANNANSLLRWRVMRGGHAQSHGSTTVARLERILGQLSPGRYVLYIQGSRTVIVIPNHESQGSA